MTATVDRSTAIADAAVAVISRDGVRGLTHRAVDRELGLPLGTTSNHARTRRDLVALVVDRLAQLSVVDVDRPSGRRRRPTSVKGAVDLLTELFDAVVARGPETRARFALTLELAADPELHELLTIASPARAHLYEQGRELLETLGVPDAQARAADLVGLLNGLAFDAVSGAERRGPAPDVRAVLTAWLAGVRGIRPARR
ncbi:TetR/AcrR family transcriptional regulator [Knoellia koreensis]|uniref:TetR family transcriptional regulator n=1 Tax=Knoellia koreensis TaxID=2730921 RepID=A0A849HT63_9MICO|nr:TetR family transcriptional regulator [Knoellia sp. DB2414S]NNM47777.1 TetR family transcriptional regulator [Knoellia sp. DB2414S]